MNHITVPSPFKLFKIKSLNVIPEFGLLIILNFIPSQLLIFKSRSKHQIRKRERN